MGKLARFRSDIERRRPRHCGRGVESRKASVDPLWLEFPRLYRQSRGDRRRWENWRGSDRTSSADARAIVVEASKAGKQVLIPCGWNFRDYTDKAAAIVADGKIGEVQIGHRAPTPAPLWSRRRKPESKC